MTEYMCVFLGSLDQVAQVRAEMRDFLDGCPVADDAVLVASELAANAVLHSSSREHFFTLRAEVHRDYIWVETEDLGGPWLCRTPDGRPHGLDIVMALAEEWGIEITTEGERVAWARIAMPQLSACMAPDVAIIGPAPAERNEHG
jgi:serine/threonine-protein kinase RsbW